MELTAGAIAAAIGARLVSGDPVGHIDGFSIDSRTLAPGELFFAIRGARFDGHDFLPAVLAGGAAGVVVGRPPPPVAPGLRRPAPAVLVVDDTTRALQVLAHHVRRASGARVVAITGSAGKTTTKELTADVLLAKYRVFRNPGNLNNHIGLPLSLLELRHRPEVAVVELGMNHAGEISTLVAVAEPEVRVWTNVGDAHLGFFPSPDGLADAKAEVMERAGRDTVLVANADDARVMARARGFAGRLVTFGTVTSADVCARVVRDRGLDGFEVLVRSPAGEIELHTALIGRGNLANVLAATAVAVVFEVRNPEIAGRIAAARPVPHRGEVRRLPGGLTLVDDSYNASPASLRIALDLIAAATDVARKVAVLGEMLELGEHAVSLHEACGCAAAEAGLALLIAVGGAPARALARAAQTSGMRAEAVQWVATSEEAAELALARVRPGDLVLVKGSRAVQTERVVERLMVEFA